MPKFDCSLKLRSQSTPKGTSKVIWIVRGWCSVWKTTLCCTVSHSIYKGFPNGIKRVTIYCTLFFRIFQFLWLPFQALPLGLKASNRGSCQCSRVTGGSLSFTDFPCVLPCLSVSTITPLYSEGNACPLELRPKPHTTALNSSLSNAGSVFGRSIKTCGLPFQMLDPNTVKKLFYTYNFNALFKSFIGTTQVRRCTTVYGKHFGFFHVYGKLCIENVLDLKLQFI